MKKDVLEKFKAGKLTCEETNLLLDGITYNQIAKSQRIIYRVNKKVYISVLKKEEHRPKSVLFQLKDIFNKEIKVCCNPEHKFSGWCPFTTFHSADSFCAESGGRG